MSLFDVLAQFLQIFVDLLPRFSRRPCSTEWCICDSFLFGPSVTLSRPVLHAPVFDKIEYWPNTEQGVNSAEQSLTTSDGKSVTVDTGFSYRITDPLILRENWGEEYRIRVSMAVRGAVQRVFNSMDIHSLGEVDHSLVHEVVSAELEEYGLELSYFCVEELVRTKAIRHYGLAIYNA